MPSKAALISLALLLCQQATAFPVSDRGLIARGNGGLAGFVMEDDGESDEVEIDHDDLSVEDLSAVQAFEETHPGGQTEARYAPFVQANQEFCSAKKLYRQGNWDLPEAEKQWLESRKANVKKSYASLMQGIFEGEEEKDVKDIVQNYRTPVIAMAVSGGGYRSMLHGAGVIQAWQEVGPLKDLADSSTYLVGVSGGAWLVAALSVNQWITVSKSLSSYGSKYGLWDISARAWAYRDVILNKAERIFWLPLQTKVGKQMRKLVQQKGTVPGNPDKFKLSSTDFWGRRLAMQMFRSEHGDGLPGYTWSNIAEQKIFLTGRMPMPIVTAAQYGPIDVKSGLVSFKLPVYEFTPFEWGTQYRVPEAAESQRNEDGSLPGSWWMSTKHMGTRIDFSQREEDAQNPLYENCVTGYDEAGFIMGASSSFFNAMELKVWTAVKEAKVLGKPLLEIWPSLGDFVQKFAGFLDDNTGETEPGPQAGAAPIPDPRVPKGDLLVVDGGMTGENLALEPLLRPQRDVQIILAIDSSNDKDVDPNGLVHSHAVALLATADKNAALEKAGLPVPGIPDIPDHKSMNAEVDRIRFFGCDQPDKPLIIYVPNHDWKGIPKELVKASSVETTVLEIDQKHRDLLIRHGKMLGQGAGNPELFSKCVGCAILWRSAGGKEALPASCEPCYDQYCWSKNERNPWKTRA